MNNREIMKALLAGEHIGFTPQWFMAFESVSLVKKLMPSEHYYDGYAEYPEEGEYGFGPIGAELLKREKGFNKYIERCAFPVGWGANAAFGHCGPGEYNKQVIEKFEDHFIVEYETGVRREVRLSPHFVHIYDHPVQSELQTDKVILPDPLKKERYEGIKQDILWAKQNGEWTVAWINGFFSAIHYFFREYTGFFMDFIDNPRGIKKIIEKNGKWTLEAARMLCESGVDCIGFCDDLGSGRSLLVSPEIYKEFIWPWHRKLCELAHSYGVKIHMHSHGAILPILRDIAEAGIDILNPIDPDEFMDLELVREAVGRRMVLCGGMDKHFFDWGRDEKALFLKNIVKNGRIYGPHILMDSGGIPDTVTKEEFDWLLVASAEIRNMKP